MKKEVCGYIKRKSLLYVTGVEYGDYTMNHILGCSHGCKYPCYAFLLKKRFGKIPTYEKWINPYIVCNTLDLLDKEIPKLKSKIKSVQLSFTTDPFMYGYKEIENLSIKAIQRLNGDNIKCTVLTKGTLPYRLSKYNYNEYGITLISLNEEYRRCIEPGAAPYKQRILALKRLHESGCKTWVSIEPYPTPNIISQNIYDILEKIKFVDRIIFGRTNYSKIVSSYKDHKIFYNNEAKKVIDFCTKNNIDYYIKRGTLTHKDNNLNIFSNINTYSNHYPSSNASHVI